MNTREIFLKTMKFTWIKLGIGFLITLVSILTLALFIGIGSLFGTNGSGMLIAFLLWVITTGGIYQLIMYYFGYMIKTAHIAVVATAVTEGTIPDAMVQYGKDKVKERFGTVNVFFVIDRLVSGSVKQLQRTVGVLDSIMGQIPVISTLLGLVRLFLGIALGYIDECCLAYTFLKTDEAPMKSACDGVCIYFQNIKHLLKNALTITLVVIISTFAMWILSFAIVGGALSIFHVSGFIAAFVAILLAIAIKTAFIDSYMMVKTMTSYLEVAPSTQITYDLYDKICSLSNKFRKMVDKLKNDEQTPTTTPS